MGGATATKCSSSSSIDSSNPHPPLLSSTASSSASLWHLPGKNVDGCCRDLDRKRDLSTDLRLGLSISPPDHNHLSSTTCPSKQREQGQDWRLIKPLLRSTLEGKAENRRRTSLFVKVYMEGIPIGRKLDLFAQEGYNALITALGQMFRTHILWPDTDPVNSEKHYYLLTYEDKEGDWMMVGDVPWEMFLTSVKRLKITRADRC